jgi:hypothetical protein
MLLDKQKQDFHFPPTVGVEMAEGTPTAGCFPPAHAAANVHMSNRRANQTFKTTPVVLLF